MTNLFSEYFKPLFKIIRLQAIGMLLKYECLNWHVATI